jgi:hypothetical protein
MFKLYRDVPIRYNIVKDTILCRLHTSHTKNLYALSLDAVLSMIHKTIQQQYQTYIGSSTSTVSVDDKEKEDQKQHSYVLEIYQYKSDVSKEFVAVAPNLIRDVSSDTIKQLGTVKLDTHTFHIFNILNHHFFNLHEVSQTEEDDLYYWKWSLEKQIHTLLNVFSPSPWATSVLLLTMMGKTNTGIMSDIFTGLNKRVITDLDGGKPSTWSENQAAYTLYKIQGPVLVYFGTSGPKDYVERALFRMFDIIDKYDIQFIVVPEEAGVPMLEELAEKWRVYQSFSLTIDKDKPTNPSISSSVFDTQWKLYTRLTPKTPVKVGDGMVIELGK